ncbi:hypothetical protein AcV7_005517 [Taiwanofungus camphoratus]|nr:hypothetical protein AcV7_005517 [Antrodia cinnamomea]
MLRAGANYAMPSAFKTTDVMSRPPTAQSKAVNAQPTPATNMTLGHCAPNNSEAEKAERLRGGCIPCPVRNKQCFYPVSSLRYMAAGWINVLYYTISLFLLLIGTRGSVV